MHEKAPLCMHMSMFITTHGVTMGQERGNCMCGGGSGGSWGSEVYPPALSLAFKNCRIPSPLNSVVLNYACLSICILYGGSMDTICLPLILLVGGSFQVLEALFRNLLGTCVLPSSLLLSPGPQVPLSPPPTPLHIPTHCLMATPPKPSLVFTPEKQTKKQKGRIPLPLCYHVS